MTVEKSQSPAACAGVSSVLREQALKHPATLLIKPYVGPFS